MTKTPDTIHDFLRALKGVKANFPGLEVFPEKGMLSLGKKTYTISERHMTNVEIQTIFARHHDKFINYIKMNPNCGVRILDFEGTTLVPFSRYITEFSQSGASEGVYYNIRPIGKAIFANSVFGEVAYCNHNEQWLSVESESPREWISGGYKWVSKMIEKLDLSLDPEPNLEACSL